LSRLCNTTGSPQPDQKHKLITSPISLRFSSSFTQQVQRSVLSWSITTSPPSHFIGSFKMSDVQDTVVHPGLPMDVMQVRSLLAGELPRSSDKPPAPHKSIEK
jgi:hypothetical protein